PARAAAPRCALPMPPDPAPASAKPRPASGPAPARAAAPRCAPGAEPRCALSMRTVGVVAGGYARARECGARLLCGLGAARRRGVAWLLCGGCGLPQYAGGAGDGARWDTGVAQYVRAGG